MIRNDVDMIRKLVATRVEDTLTREDLLRDAQLWSEGLREGYSSVFNLGSADVSGVTMDDLQAYIGMLPPKMYSVAHMVVVNSDEQRELIETFMQMAEQAGLPVENFRILDNVEDAINCFVEHHL